MTPPVRASIRTHRFAADADPSIRVDPSPATSDKNVVRGPAPNNPADNEQSLARGGKVKRTGSIKAHKDEFVVRKAAAMKLGPKKMAAVNAGKAKVSLPKKGKH